MSDYTINSENDILKTSVDIGTTGIAATSIALEFPNGERTLIAEGDSSGDILDKKVGKGSELKNCKIHYVTLISFNHIHEDNFDNAVNASTAEYFIKEGSETIGSKFSLDNGEITSNKKTMVASFKKLIEFI